MFAKPARASDFLASSLTSAEGQCGAKKNQEVSTKRRDQRGESLKQ